MANSRNNQNQSKDMFGSKELLDYCWNYFELQSKQRNQTCQLYFTLLTALIGGFFAVAKLNMRWAEYVILGAIAVNALLSCLLFMRTTNLRNACRVYIKKIEEEYIEDQTFQLFHFIEGKLRSRKFSNGATYTILFYLQFILVFVVALSLIVFIYNVGTLNEQIRNLYKVVHLTGTYLLELLENFFE